MKNFVSVVVALVLSALVAAQVAAPASAGTRRRNVAPVRPIHVLKDSSVLEARFAGELKLGVEYHAIIEMAKGGQIEIALYAETAPNHVANFVTLARQGFYDSVTFHRVIPGFMAQGGDPTGTGGSGPGYTIRAEFSNVAHKRGTVSMARTSDPNSAGSQFFICFGPAPFLDGQYSAFGEIIKGMEVVDAIRPRDPQRNPNFTGDAMKKVTIVEITAPRPHARQRRRSKGVASGDAGATASGDAPSDSEPSSSSH